MADTLAEKVVQPAVNPQTMAYCPTMDLIALATVEDDVHVYRLNGQKVFEVQSKQQSAKVRKTKWRPDGHSLAIAYDDHSLCLTSAHTGKVIHTLSCSQYSKSQICCLGWGINFTESKKVSEHVSKLANHLTLDDIIGRNPQIKNADNAPDLPLDLAFLDVEASLPKLGPLSFGGIEDDIFNSRTSLDLLFQPLTPGSTDSADILVVGFEDGIIHLSIYDLFEIGDFNLKQTLHGFQTWKPVLHSFHPCSTTHSLLVMNSIAGQDELHLVPMDLRLLSKTGRYLSMLALKSTQLLNLLRYIQQVQRQMYSDFKASQELPHRFIANIEETLREQSDCNWIQAAYHTVVTGNCYPEVKEWLVDQLGERGHKRWEKATSTGYDSIRRLAHENLLPALEKLNVLVSRLRGLSKFAISNMTLGLSSPDLDNVIDIVGCLQLVAHRILIAASLEHRQFQAFSKWLRNEIDTQAAEQTSSEIGDAEIDVDYTSTLEYIQGPMMQSRLIHLFDLENSQDQSSQRDLTEKGRSLFELYKQQYQNEKRETPSVRQLPGLDALIGLLRARCDIVFESIADTQRRNVRFGAPTLLSARSSTIMDMITVPEPSGRIDGVVTYVALGPTATQSEVLIHKITMDVVNGMSSTRRCEIAVIPTGDLEIKDIKFVDDQELLLAVSDHNSSRLLRITYRGGFDKGPGLEYLDRSDPHERASSGKGKNKVTGAPTLDLSNTADFDVNTWRRFPNGASWAPLSAEVNGRKGRRVVCVLAQDRLHYRIYDLDAPTTPENVHDG